MSDDVKAALAEIDRRIGDAIALSSLRARPSLEHWGWALEVLRGDREVLERHTAYPRCEACGARCDECVYLWPCPDAARVLRRYLSESL